MAQENENLQKKKKMLTIWTLLNKVLKASVELIRILLSEWDYRVMTFTRASLAEEIYIYILYSIFGVYIIKGINYSSQLYTK